MFFIFTFAVLATAQRYPSSSSVLGRNLGPDNHYSPVYFRQQTPAAPAEDPPLAKFGDVVPIAGRV